MSMRSHGGTAVGAPAASPINARPLLQDTIRALLSSMKGGPYQLRLTRSCLETNSRRASSKKSQARLGKLLVVLFDCPCTLLENKVTAS